MRKKITLLTTCAVIATTFITSQAHAISSVHEIGKAQAEICGKTAAGLLHSKKRVTRKQLNEALSVAAQTVALFNKLEKKLHTKKDIEAARTRAEECELAIAGVVARRS